MISTFLDRSKSRSQGQNLMVRNEPVDREHEGLGLKSIRERTLRIRTYK